MAPRPVEIARELDKDGSEGNEWQSIKRRLQQFPPVCRSLLQSKERQNPKPGQEIVANHLHHELAYRERPSEGASRSGKNEVLQTATLQVLFSVVGNFSTGGKQEHGRELCAGFLWSFTCAEFSLAVLPFAVFQETRPPPTRGSAI